MKHHNEIDIYVAVFGFQALAERFGPDVAAEYLQWKIEHEGHTPTLEPAPR